MKYWIITLLWSLELCAAPHNLLIQKFENIKSIQAHFSQTVMVKGRKKAQTSGEFAVLRPGKLRWSIQRPHPQLLVANGHTVWVYEPGLHQATKKPQSKGVGGTAGLFLSQQPGLWIQRYHVSMSANGDFELTAKQAKTPFSRVLLHFQGNTLVGLEFWDQMGQNSRIVLSGVKMNAQIPASSFQFHPPKNTDVINL